MDDAVAKTPKAAKPTDPMAAVPALAAAILADSGFIAGVQAILSGAVGEAITAHLADHPPEAVKVDMSSAIEDERFAELLGNTVNSVFLAAAASDEFGEVVDQRISTYVLDDAFAGLVGSTVAEHLRDAKGAALITTLVDAHLDKQLPVLVEAAMPETPEKAAARAAEAKAEAVGKQDRADQRQHSALEKAARRIAKERDAEKANAREARVAIVDAAEDRALLVATGEAEAVAAIDLAAFTGGKLWLDDGRSFSIDFSRAIETPEELAAVDGGILLKSPPIPLGDDMPERFTVQAVVMMLALGEDTRVLRCMLPHPVIAGGGARAQFSADSLVFKPI